MKKILIALLIISACSKKPDNTELIAKMDKMKNCLEYTDQKTCEDKVGIHIFTDEKTNQKMFRDTDSGEYVLPMQGQNGQPVYQNLGQSYPQPQVINNYIPQQSSNHDFFLGAVLGMSMMHMAGGGD
jgi:hypothetical protein